MIAFHATSRKAGHWHVSDIKPLCCKIFHRATFKIPTTLVVDVWKMLDIIAARAPYPGWLATWGTPAPPASNFSADLPSSECYNWNQPSGVLKNFIVSNASFDLRFVMKLVHKLPCCTLHFLLSPISYLAILKIMHNILNWSLWSLRISFVTSSSLGQSRLSAGKALQNWLWGKDTVQAVTFWGVFKVSLCTSSPQLGFGIANCKGNDL